MRISRGLPFNACVNARACTSVLGKPAHLNHYHELHQGVAPPGLTHLTEAVWGASPIPAAQPVALFARLAQEFSSADYGISISVDFCKIPQKSSLFVIFGLPTTIVACATQPQIEDLFLDF